MPEPGVSLQELHQQVGLLPLALWRTLHLVEQVGPLEAGDERLRVVQGQLLDDVAAHAVGGRGGQGDGRRVAQQLAKIAQPGVIGAKIVPPLADAMGLVDGQQLAAPPPAPPPETARCETAPAPRRPGGTGRPPSGPAGRIARPSAACC